MTDAYTGLSSPGPALVVRSFHPPAPPSHPASAWISVLGTTMTPVRSDRAERERRIRREGSRIRRSWRPPARRMRESMCPHLTAAPDLPGAPARRGGRAHVGTTAGPLLRRVGARYDNSGPGFRRNDRKSPSTRCRTASWRSAVAGAVPSPGDGDQLLRSGCVRSIGVRRFCGACGTRHRRRAPAHGFATTSDYHPGPDTVVGAVRGAAIAGGARGPAR